MAQEVMVLNNSVTVLDFVGGPITVEPSGQVRGWGDILARLNAAVRADYKLHTGSLGFNGAVMFGDLMEFAVLHHNVARTKPASRVLLKSMLLAMIGFTGSFVERWITEIYGHRSSVTIQSH